MYCFDCGEKIVTGDDEAQVCIECGGLNRRLAKIKPISLEQKRVEKEQLKRKRVIKPFS